MTAIKRTHPPFNSACPNPIFPTQCALFLGNSLAHGPKSQQTTLMHKFTVPYLVFVLRSTGFQVQMIFVCQRHIWGTEENCLKMLPSCMVPPWDTMHRDPALLVPLSPLEIGVHPSTMSSCTAVNWDRHVSPMSENRAASSFSS